MAKKNKKEDKTVFPKTKYESQENGYPYLERWCPICGETGLEVHMYANQGEFYHGLCALRNDMDEAKLFYGKDIFPFIKSAWQEDEEDINTD